MNNEIYFGDKRLDRRYLTMIRGFVNSGNCAINKAVHDRNFVIKDRKFWNYREKYKTSFLGKGRLKDLKGDRKNALKVYE